MPKNIYESRMDGCTLGCALSVACFIPGAVAVVHAPEGCVHQTFSMLSTMMNDCDTRPPEILVSGMGDREVIFGGEECLRAALDRAAERCPDLIFVMTSCVSETIGDDCGVVCARHPYADRILYVPTSGFLGGSGKDGENAALVALGSRVQAADSVPGTVAILGEKNLESEAADALLARRFDRPIVPEFPQGLFGCLKFLREAGEAAQVPSEKIREAFAAESAYQEVMLERFSGLCGRSVFLGAEPFAGTSAVAREVIDRLAMTESSDDFLIRLPFYLPVGTVGVEKMLYLWRRVVNNG